MPPWPWRWGPAAAMAEAPWLQEPVLERVEWILRSHAAAFGRP